jgi:predicted phage terminase large subunit-like protein
LALKNTSSNTRSFDGLIVAKEPVHFSREELDFLLDNIEHLEDSEAKELLQIAQVLEDREFAQKCRDDLIEFCKAMQDGYKVGTHHRHLATLLMDCEKGEKDRVTVSIAPRHGKSQMTSIFFTAWFLGKNPHKQVMLVSHTADLAVDFGRKVRNLFDTQEYQSIFPGVHLAIDSKSAGRWNTNKGGVFYATGVGSSLAGRGADLLIIDDPHSEQDMLAGNFDSLETAYKWFLIGARTRLMPSGRVVIVATRWHKSDLIGKLINDMSNDEEVDQYHVVEFPAILNENTDEEKALWPQFFDLEALRRTRSTMPAYQWNAQYQQNPTGDSSSICKRDWWRIWDSEEPPDCEYIIQAIDAAAELNNRSDFTSITTWGVFWNDETSMSNLILLNSVRERMEFPELKVKVLDEYREWQPDSCLVEKKSSGTALYQELRRMGVPVGEYTPHRGTINNPNNKYARLNSVIDMVREGIIWVPHTRWAEQLVEELAEFPYGDHDDVVDTTIMALTRFRQGGFAQLATDHKDEPAMFKRRGGYY